MLTAHRVSSRAFWGTALVAVMTVALSLGLVSGVFATPRPGARAVLATGLAKLSEITPSDPSDSIREVVQLGKDNVFLVRFRDMVDVYQLRADDTGAATVRIGQIPVPNGVSKIMVLDDQSSFIIQNSTGLATFSVSKEPTGTTSSTTR